MMAIFEDLSRIIALRRGPEDLPYSLRLLVAAVMAAAGLHWVLATLGPRELHAGGPWLTVAIGVGYKLAFLDGVLQLRGLAYRRVKTLSAAFGTDALLSLPALVAVGMAGEDTAHPGLTAFLLGLSIWQLVVLTHILTRALEARTGEATLWILAYVLGSVVLFTLLAAD